MHSLCAVLSYFTGKALGTYQFNATVQCHSALLARARPTMFYIPLVISKQLNAAPYLRHKPRQLLQEETVPAVLDS